MSLIAQYATIMALLLPVFACAGIGAYWGYRKREFPGGFIVDVVSSITTPALVFHTLSTTQMDNELLLQVLGAALAGLALMACLSAAALYLLRLPVAALLPTATFPNAGNLGLPVAQFVSGDTGFTVALAIFVIFSVSQHTLGVWMLGWAGRKVSTSKRALPYGVMVACVVAIGLRVAGLPVPEPVLGSAHLVGSLTVPLMLLSLGYALATVSRSGISSGLTVGLLRLAVGGVGGYTVAWLFGLEATVASSVILQMVMPSAVISYLYTARYTDSGEISAGAILTSTAIFLALSPLIIGWVGGG